jgi:hypothetical protein
VAILVLCCLDRLLVDAKSRIFGHRGVTAEEACV